METKQEIKTVDEVIGEIIYREYAPEDGEELEIGGRSVRCRVGKIIYWEGDPEDGKERVNEIGTFFEIEDDPDEDYDEIQYVTIVHAAYPNCETDWHHCYNDRGEIDCSIDVDEAISYMAKYLGDDIETIEDVKKNFVSTKIESVEDTIRRIILPEIEPETTNHREYRQQQYCEDGDLYDIYDEYGEEVEAKIIYHEHDGNEGACYCGDPNDDLGHWYSVDDDGCWDEINIDDLLTTD
ncbi:hypothetical protein [Gimesia sp.]|uniref:hypothetical protein n=1 Tax=Gimesia sp. TaxID=2024833 RepID=UPI000C574A82|nr:hypothetical protein [Gimesia sp.]MAX35813.1 hypothetical protein [Gimesia sp.]HAH48881.1 hypothetical protein [Planctomycetaceae bacterium]